MGLFGNNDTTQQNGTLNLGITGAPTYGGGMGAGMGMGMGYNSFGAQQNSFSQNPFSQGMMGGMGMQQGMMGQSMQPPSEAEIQLALMRSVAPIDRFISSPQMATFISMLNDLVSFSILEVMKSAVFVINEEDGTMKMDVASLPSNLQTMSAENVTGQFNSLQMSSQQNIQNNEMQQQQILGMAQQSMMGGALQAALADEGMMNKVGGGIGTFARSMIGGR